MAQDSSRPPDDGGDSLWRSFAKDVRPLKNQEEKIPSPPPAIRSPLVGQQGQRPLLEERCRSANLSFREESRPPLSLGRRQRRRIQVEAVLDLHGVTQQGAVPILLRFIEAKFGQKNRCVLVITGKGRSSPSVLKELVISLLSTEVFRPFVRGFTEASARDGGSGALYVFLK